MDDILLHIVGYSDYGDDAEGMEITTAGKLMRTDGEIQITFDDQKLIDDGAVTTNIIIREDSIIMTKTGAVQTHFVFEAEKTFNATYVTPYGRVELLLYPTLVGASENETGGNVQLEYVTNLSGLQIVNRLDLSYYKDCAAVRS